MEIPFTRFDATDPFAQAKLQMKQASQAITQYVHETAVGTAQ